MVTGEETIQVPGALCQSCTVEMLNDHEYFDIVVVDECQMVGDPSGGITGRGRFWGFGRRRFTFVWHRRRSR